MSVLAKFVINRKCFEQVMLHRFSKTKYRLPQKDLWTQHFEPAKFCMVKNSIQLHSLLIAFNNSILP